VSEQGSNSIEGSTALQRAFRNFGKLLRGRGVAAVLELVTVALLARELTPAPFGKIVLIQTYVLVVRGLLNFKLYEVLIRFGVPLLETGKNSSFKQLLQITIFIDCLSAVAATVIAIAVAKMAGSVLGWDADMAPLTMIYCGVLLTYGFGTAKGLLRIYDRYDVLGIQIMIAPVLRLAGVLLVMFINPTLLWFVIALTITSAIGNIYLLAKGWGEMRRQVGSIEWSGSALKAWRQEFGELPKFIAIVYWQGNIDMLPRHITTLLAGSILGPAGAGLLRLAREATKILSKPGALLRQVLFPDMVRMWVRRSPEFRAILVRSLLISMLAGVVMTGASMFGGAYLFTAALGPDYAAAAPLLSLLLLATTLELMATVLRSAGYAMGHAGAILKQNLFSSVIYLAAFIALTPLWGLIGPGFAACIAAMLPLVGTGYLVRRDMRVQEASVS
jgi:O-antigen/teichoic acid export membrane protein